MVGPNLALVVALAGAQPACPADAPCPEVEAVLADAASNEDAAADSGAIQSDEIVVQGEVGAPQGDPAEKLNLATFEVVQKVDQAIVEPLAEAYDEGVPKPLRKGLRNFLSNLGEPINFLNSLLQLKPGRAVGRFAINTTIGVGGVMNPAAKKPFNLKREPNGFANTLGVYGVKQGAYLYLPFIGSTTVRDLTGRLIDLSIIPAVAGKPFNDPLYAIPVGALNSLETRIQIDSDIETIRSKCSDQYSATRDLYLIQRQIEIDSLRGKESKDLADLIDKLEFNCDITLLTSGQIASEDEAMSAEMEAREMALAVEAVQEAEVAVAAEPEIAVEQEPRFVSEPVVQPLPADDASDQSVDHQQQSSRLEIFINTTGQR